MAISLLAGAGLALQGVSFLTGLGAKKSAAKSARTQAKIESKYLGEQLTALGESEANLEPVRDSRIETAQAGYIHDIGNLSAETGQSKEDLQVQLENMIQKSGLATPGSANVKSSQMWKRIVSGFQSGQQGLMGRLGEKMGAVEEWYESEKARLNSEKMRIEFQKKQADARAFPGMLGVAKRLHEKSQQS